MQKHTYKKRQMKKFVPVPDGHSSTLWEWMPAGLTVIIVCLALAVFTLSQGRTLKENSLTHPPAMSINAPMPMGSDTPGSRGSRQTIGIFPLSRGGPIPVPANVLRPNNIARVVVNNVLTSIYAGAMTRTPAIGAVAILSEDLTTGQQSLHLYATFQHVGALTILAVQKDILSLSAPKTKGTFNLRTKQFRF